MAEVLEQTTESTERGPDYPGFGNWMDGLKEIGVIAPQTEGMSDALNPTPKPKEEQNGKTGQNGTGMGDDTGTAAGAPDKPTATPAKPDSAAANPAVKPDASSEQPAADKTADKPAEADADDDKWPRNSKDWEKFRTKHQAREEKLRSEVEAERTRAKQLETQLAEAKKTPLKNAATDSELKAQLDAAVKRNDELTKRITVLDVTQHPDFQAHFDQKTSAQLELAKRIVGPDLAADAEKLLKMPDSDYKTIQMEEFVGGLGDLQKTRFGGILNELERIAQEKQSEIEKATVEKTKVLQGEGERAEKARIAIEQQVEQAIAITADKEKGMKFYQMRDGDDEWNKGVTARQAAVRSLLTAKPGTIPPEQIAEAVFNSVAFPDMLKEWDAQVKALVAERDKYAAQVKTLSAAKPGAPRGGTPNPGAPNAEQPNRAGEAADPHAVSRRFADTFAKGMRGEG